MAKVRSLHFAGKTVNVAHSENQEIGEGGASFDENGEAEVSEILADSLVEAFPRQIEKVATRKRKAAAKSK